MNGTSPALRVRNLTKRFGEVIANDAVSIDAWAGEVHCLLGENGAGKSTLIAMLAGLQQPDAGFIELGGATHPITSPAEAIERGIGVVYQHSALIPSMTVLENLMLSQREGFWVNRTTALAHLAALNATLDSPVGPDDRLSSLSLGQRQQLDIARVMWQRPRVLVLDEPTSMLGGQGIEELLASVREVVSQGVAVILVTHKLDEALALGDRVTVLRAGRVARRFEGSELSALGEDRARGEIVAAMFGGAEPSALGLDRLDRRPRPLSPSKGAGEGTRPSSLSRCTATLVLEGVATSPGSALVPLDGVTLQISAGEILGLAGVDGQGQRQLAEIIAGQCAPSAGRVLLDGDDITKMTVRERQLLGVRYVTDDRLGEGIVGSLSVALNLLLKRIGERPFWRFGCMRRDEVREHANHLSAQYGIRASSSDAAAGTLSGGNIQKILLARELEGDPKVVVFHKPSYGLDSRTVQFVHDEMRRLAEHGAAVLLMSTELDELTSLSHRIAVLSRGSIVGVVENEGEAVREHIGTLVAGGAL